MSRSQEADTQQPRKTEPAEDTEMEWPGTQEQTGEGCTGSQEAEGLKRKE